MSRRYRQGLLSSRARNRYESHRSAPVPGLAGDTMTARLPGFLPPEAGRCALDPSDRFGCPQQSRGCAVTPPASPPDAARWYSWCRPPRPSQRSTGPFVIVITSAGSHGPRCPSSWSARDKFFSKTRVRARGRCTQAAMICRVRKSSRAPSRRCHATASGLPRATSSATTGTIRSP